MAKLNNWYTYQTNKDAGEFTTGETNLDPSLTVPGMSMSLSELLERFASGRSIRLLPAEFDDAEVQRMDLPDLSKMDKMEKAELKLKNIQEIKQHQKNLEILKKAKENIIQQPTKAPTPKKATPKKTSTDETE